MKDFTRLYQAIDRTTKTGEKVAAMEAYFAAAPSADAAWAVYFLGGQKLQRLVNTTRLRQWACEAAELPAWLLEESYEWVGDLGETLAAVVPEAESTAEGGLAEWVEGRLLPLRRMDEAGQREAVLAAWRELDQPQRLVFNKLITGSFRVGVSQGLLVRAVAAVAGVSVEAVSHRLMGRWSPSADFYEQLVSPEEYAASDFQPYPFCLAQQIEGDVRQLGEAADYVAEWKWDGIRAQLIRRGGKFFAWSRGEERVEERFPELAAAAPLLPDGTVLDGEILAWGDGAPRPFADLQRRIGRKTVGKKLLAEVPVSFVAFDLLEFAGVDLRARPLAERRAQLERVVAAADSPAVQLSRRVELYSWEELAEARAACRERAAEGLMLKRLDSPYAVGRVRGVWWKWKIEPYSVDAVMTAAQRGHGRRASLYTDYTFSLWEGGELVPFAKAYSGLTDEELRRVDAFVRQNTLERFGPVRTVKPALVMEIAFENLQVSKRHKSGVAVRFPRILRWRLDKTPPQADTLETLKRLAAGQGE